MKKIKAFFQKIATKFIAKRLKPGETSKGTFRHILTFAGGVLVAMGYTDEETVQTGSEVIMEASGAVLALWGFITSVINKIKTRRREDANATA